MVDGTYSHGIVEEPSAAAQAEAACGGPIPAFKKDEAADYATAEQGMTAEPSAKAQEAVLQH